LPKGRWTISANGEMNNILLDTNILIYLLQGSRTVKELLEDKLWLISYISEMELLAKPEITDQEQKAIEWLLSECTIIEMNGVIKSKAISNARSFKLKLADSIVLATAQVNGIPLLTADSVFKKLALTSNEVLLFKP
jgi:predicted nucleic acid-binding protein